MILVFWRKTQYFFFFCFALITLNATHFMRGRTPADTEASSRTREKKPWCSGKLANFYSSSVLNSHKPSKTMFQLMPVYESFVILFFAPLFIKLPTR